MLNLLTHTHYMGIRQVRYGGIRRSSTPPYPLCDSPHSAFAQGEAVSATSISFRYACSWCHTPHARMGEEARPNYAGDFFAAGPESVMY